MKTNIRPLPLTAAQAALIPHRARALFNAAVGELAEELAAQAIALGPFDPKALRYEVAMALLRIALAEMHGEPAVAAAAVEHAQHCHPSPQPPHRCICGALPEPPPLAEGTPPGQAVADPFERVLGIRVGPGDRACARCAGPIAPSHQTFIECNLGEVCQSCADEAFR